MMTKLSASMAIIGGTGLNEFAQGERVSDIATPFGAVSAPIICADHAGSKVAFIARHGQPHSIAPHRVNYRANLWGLKRLGVEQVIAINAVGGINNDMPAGTIVIPDQIIDYTYGRDHTFFDGSGGCDGYQYLDGERRLFEKIIGAGFDPAKQHIDFTHPFNKDLRGLLKDAAESQNIPIVSTGTYAATQGPRLETAAEIKRLEQDGCDIVGMTAMPEAGLASELGMAYASVCLVVNPAAGKSSKAITMEDIHRVIDGGMSTVRQLLQGLIVRS
jgi:5'-deoxy-5'-methylthioadenosine phosphorylase